MPMLTKSTSCDSRRAKEPLFASEIAEHLNSELRPDSAYSTMEVAKRLKGMSEQVAQLLDGRWMLKRLML